MKREFTIFLFLVMLLSPVWALEDNLQKREICFNQQEQNCLFINLLPIGLGIITIYALFYLKYSEKIVNLSNKQKTIWIILALGSFFILEFVASKFYIFDKCLVP